MRKETEVLAEMLDMSRKLTQYYIDKLNGADLHKVFKTESGEKFNSAYWIIAHLAVTENWLILYSTHGEAERISWGKMFALGAPQPQAEFLPAIDEVMNIFHRVHEKAVSHIMSLSDEMLDSPTKTATTFGGEDSCRKTIMHAVRHEANHAGHLGWLCKMYGIKTI